MTGYCEQPHAHEGDSLDEMDWLLGTHSLPKLTQVDTVNMSASIKDTESLTDNLPKQEASGPDGLTGEFY